MFDFVLIKPITYPRYIAQIRDLLDRGAPISGLGLQTHLGPQLIDLAKAEDTFTRLDAEFGLPLWVTEFDWRDEEFEECTDISYDHAQHAIELDNFFRLVLR